MYLFCFVQYTHTNMPYLKKNCFSYETHQYYYSFYRNCEIKCNVKKY